MTNHGQHTATHSRSSRRINHPAVAVKILLPALWRAVSQRAIPLSRRPPCMVRPLMMFCPPFNREVLP
ncbi:hypothetical protein [Acidithiobacillus sp.]|uniref:hypothetical protein n=1 Tax=Acidithiobacillus sp. TaxID=1872118 RepID=UPI00260F44FB|nr:hypothetical protein [Acidithiobacillus sp.]MDD2750815.1 hypothetical protein [Acidithiobacillus sp.]MDD5280327.1 hypothetical protein [Acidithiobacillus sp.]